MRRPLLVATANLLLAGCGMSGPPPAEYVLGTAPPATIAATPITTLPVIEVKRVQLPDYLDTKSLLVRSGNELKPSTTGRWGERLSLGVTRAVAASLAARLPNVSVTTAPPVEPPALQLLIDVDAFETTAGQAVVLTGTWTIADGSGRSAILAERFCISAPAAEPTDKAMVTAMSRAVDDLGGRIAAGVPRSLPRRMIK
jgi:uncharacterized lipoprotein YmbA